MIMKEMETITIEPYQISHQQHVIDLILPIQQIEFKVPITLKDQPDLFNVDEVYRKGNGNFWVALFDANVIGSIALIDCGDGLGALRKMFVHKDFRGKEKGTAQLLLDELTRWAVAKGFEEIILGTVEVLVAAQKFYLKNGFTLINKKDLPANFALMQVDTLFFIKKLNQKI